MQRCSQWHHGTLRRSLLNAFYPGQLFDMEKISRRKAERKFGVQKSFKRQVIKDYDLWDKLGRGPHTGPVWNVVNGAWEPPSQRPDMIAAHIVPQMLGKRLMRKLFGDHHHFHDLYGSRNALLLPAGVAYAVDEWAITIVPHLPEDPTEQEKRAWVASDPKEYKFRVLDAEHEHLQERISAIPEDLRLGRDLDQQPLRFRETSPFRPSVKYLYFGHCCAVMSRYHHLYYDDPPREYLESLSPRRREKILSKHLWHKELNLRSRSEFWQRMVHELSCINEDPNLLLEWSMNMREPR